MESRLVHGVARSLAALVVGTALLVLVAAGGLVAAHPPVSPRVGAGSRGGGRSNVSPTATSAAAPTLALGHPEQLTLAIVASAVQAQTVQDDLAMADALRATSGAATPHIVFVVLSDRNVLPSVVAGKPDVAMVDLRQGRP